MLEKSNTYQCVKVFCQVQKDFLFPKVIGEKEYPVVLMCLYYVLELSVRYLPRRCIEPWISECIVQKQIVDVDRHSLATLVPSLWWKDNFILQHVLCKAEVTGVQDCSEPGGAEQEHNSPWAMCGIH